MANVPVEGAPPRFWPRINYNESRKIDEVVGGEPIDPQGLPSSSFLFALLRQFMLYRLHYKINDYMAS